MPALTYAMQQALFDRSVGIRRRNWPPGEYVQAHLVEDPPPAALLNPSETVTLYIPTPDDESATDWERA